MSFYIKLILWCLFFFVMLFGFIVIFIVFDMLENEFGEENCICCVKELLVDDGLKFKFKYCCCNKCVVCYNREGLLICFVNFLCYFFFLIELIIVLIIWFLNILEFKYVLYEIYILVVCIIFEGIVLCFV